MSRTTMSKFGEYIGNTFVGAVATLEKRGVESQIDTEQMTGEVPSMAVTSTLKLEDVWMIRPSWRGHGPVTESSYGGSSGYRQWLSMLRETAPIEFSYPDADWDGWKPLP